MKIWRPYTQMQTALEPLSLIKAEGAYLYTEKKQKIFDGISSWWLITHGHSHPQIVEAISRQSQKLSQAVFANFSHEPAEQFAELLQEVLPQNLNRLFFSDNGSTAVEVAMKMAYQYMQQSGFNKKTKFIAFANSYHGDTCGAMSVSADGVYTQAYKNLKFDIFRCQQGQSVQDPLEKWVSDFKKCVTENHEEVCAVLIEPLLQGAGGMLVWPIEAIQQIVTVARQYGILVIFDEVMTGFGRTGTLFAFEQVGHVPDFLCLSKGVTAGFLPMGLTVTTQQIYEAFLDSDPQKMFFHGHSFTGNALSCAAAAANLQIFKEEQTLNKISVIQQTHQHCLQQMKTNQNIQSKIKEIRTCGAVGVLELNSEHSYAGLSSQIWMQKSLEKNLFLRPLGSVIYLMPPYCADVQDIEQAWAHIGEIIESL
ncbi:MAG: adenosylmethionine--8-amino-7-oxononanoate transaminase [Pseudobdellovibrionaceae bacterium]